MNWHSCHHNEWMSFRAVYPNRVRTAHQYLSIHPEVYVVLYVHLLLLRFFLLLFPLRIALPSSTLSSPEPMLYSYSNLRPLWAQYCGWALHFVNAKANHLIFFNLCICQNRKACNCSIALESQRWQEHRTLVLNVAICPRHLTNLKLEIFVGSGQILCWRALGYRDFCTCAPARSSDPPEDILCFTIGTELKRSKLQHPGISGNNGRAAFAPSK